MGKIPGEIFLVVPAGGRGLRLGGGVPKQFRDWGGRPLLLATLEAFFSPGMPPLDGIALAVPPEFVDLPPTWKLPVPLRVGPGGETRQDSVRAALELLPDRPEAAVMIHDAVRPFPPAQGVLEALEALGEWDGALLTEPSTDTLKQVDRSGRVLQTLHREGILRAQTPQVALLGTWREAFQQALTTGFQATDDSALLERFGFKVLAVPGAPSNRKITLPGDWSP
ncbi:MAG: 2-C-methyl-D-erythritol 4-phosphate cytidylyltransferase [Acidobacteria bacterium]|nr:2-C-methyl-D-erythritol 4-phosphate cytidylyltransferase [Acidobacteriota bacterium]